MLQKLEESQPGEVHNRKTALSINSSLAKQINEITKQINKNSNRDN